MSKRNPLDPRDQIAATLGARRVCPWCYPHFRAKLEGRWATIRAATTSTAAATAKIERG